uniref:Methyltransferase domain-containing protein n=1 Tax=Hemiselmis tepida TaxID=464990 RepID=A0A6T6SLL3_9CRYP|mmetsp:Transcript_17849/g.45039  ORF Transcript_17849/g.45039 Transcript_17849/m.45039 type:complete len:363 (+) Transcript_17849:153-1241(+)
MSGIVSSVGVFFTYRFLKMGIWIFENNLLPDFIARWGMRRLLSVNLAKMNIEDERAKFMSYVESLKSLPIAMNTADANEQHYEIPPEFYFPIMGKRLKYSSCIFPKGMHNDDIDGAEVAALKQVEERAQLEQGQQVLELGCGWGSLSLWMAERFPKSTFTSVSNSNNQKLFIDGRAKELGIKNLTVITADMNEFAAPSGKQYDRVMSIEMFEHMKNYDLLFSRVTSWLKPGGKAFIHIFCHKHLAYNFETEGDDNWMGKYFFTGGTMPAETLFLYFCHPLKLVNQWAVNGVHYSKTLEVWLRRMDANMGTIGPILDAVYGKDNRTLWTARWRGFFLACSELFRYNQGNEWFVGHYLFEKPLN